MNPYKSFNFISNPNGFCDFHRGMINLRFPIKMLTNICIPRNIDRGFNLLIVMVMRELRLIPNSANFCYHIFCWWKSGGRGGDLHSKTKYAWRRRLGKLWEHFAKIWSEFYFDISSKISVNCTRRILVLEVNFFKYWWKNKSVLKSPKLRGVETRKPVPYKRIVPTAKPYRINALFRLQNRTV